MARNGTQGLGHIPYERDAYWRKSCAFLGFQCFTKKEIFDRLGYIPLPTLEKMHRSRATHRILIGGNRSGKTYGAAWEVIPYLFWLNTCGWVVTTTYETGEETRRKIEDILIERAGMEKVLRADNLKPWQFSYGSKTHTFVMGTGSWFQLKSADAPDSMHAVPLHWVLIDEAALLPWMLYDTRLVPRLIDYAGWILSIGTLEWLTGEWLEEYFDLGQMPNTMGVESWRHPTDDNYHIYTATGGETPEVVAEKYHVNFHKLRTTNPGVEWPLKPGQQVYVWNIDLGWLDEQRNRVAPEIFAARYSAQRATNPYTVFPEWSIQSNVSDSRCAFDPDLPVYLAVDPGGTYAAAAVQFKKFDDVGEENTLTKGLSMCVIDEIYFQSTVTTEEVYAACAKKKWWQNVARWPWPHWDKRQGVIDVTAHEQQRAWMHLAMKDDKIRQLHLTGRKVDVQAGIQTLQHYISTKSLYAAPHCTFMNLEMRRYHYPEPSVADVGTIDPRKAPNPVDEWNHLIKAITYLAVGMFGCYGVESGKAVMKRRSIAEERKQEEGRKIMNAVAKRYNRRKK